MLERVEQLFRKKDIDGLKSLLGAAERELRIESAQALGQLRHPGTVPALINAMGDDEVAVRWAAAKALTCIGPSAVPALVDTLHGTGGRLSPYALWALGEIGSPKAVAALSEAIQSPLWEERWSAVASLGDVGGAQVSTALVRALGDRDERVRKAAGQALQKLGEQSLEPLAAALNHPERLVREEAHYVLAKIDSPKSQAILRHRKLSFWVPVVAIVTGVMLVLVWLGSLLSK